MLVEIISVVPEILVYAAAFTVERTDVEGITGLYQRIRSGECLIFLLREAGIRNGVDAKERTETDVIGYLGRP